MYSGTYLKLHDAVNSQRTHYILPSRASYGVYFVSIFFLKKMYKVLKKLHCRTVLFMNFNTMDTATFVACVFMMQLTQFELNKMAAI